MRKGGYKCAFPPFFFEIKYLINENGHTHLEKK